MLCAIAAQPGLAQRADDEGRTVLVGQIQGGLIDKALIERERARPDVPDDFADNMLTYANRRIDRSLELASRRGQRTSIWREAQAGANRIINAQPRTDFLRLFPDPQRVKNDMAAEFGDVSDVVLAGRQVGRMSMLANALKGLQSVTDVARLNPDVAQMRQRYFLYFYDLRDRMEPTYTDTCPSWQFWCKTRHQTFFNESSDYENDLAPAQEVAARYFPASFRERFIDATGRGGSRKAYSDEEARKNAERDEQSRREWVETLTPVVVFLWLGLLIGIFVLIIWAWAWVSGKGSNGGRPPLSDNHGSAEWGAMNMDVHPIDPLRGVFLGKYAWPHHADGQVKTPPVFTKPEAHTLIMAPTRTGKEYGYVVDYMSLLKKVNKAIAVYSSEIDTSAGGEDPAVLMKDRLEKGRERLDDALEVFALVCEPVETPKGELQYIHYFCGNTEIATDLAEHEPQRAALYKAVASLVRAYAGLADEMEEAGYTATEIARIKKKVEEAVAVRDTVRNASGEMLDLKAYEADMRHLIDTYIEADEPRKISPFDNLSLLDLVVKSGLAEAIASQLAGMQDREAIAETIENNVRAKIVKEHLNDPAFYERISTLLDEIIKARKAKALDYEAYLAQIGDLITNMVTGHSDTTPPALDTAGKRALYNNLGDNEDLALGIDAAVKANRPDGWRGVEPKERAIKAAMYAVLYDVDEVERLFPIIKSQPEY